MYAKMLMHATAQWGCTDTVRESAMEVDSGRKIPCSAWDSVYMCVCVCVCLCVCALRIVYRRRRFYMLKKSRGHFLVFVSG